MKRGAIGNGKERFIPGKSSADQELESNRVVLA